MAMLEAPTVRTSLLTKHTRRLRTLITRTFMLFEHETACACTSGDDPFTFVYVTAQRAVYY